MTRAVSKTVGADTVYLEYQVEDSKLNFQGAYRSIDRSIVLCLRVAGSVNAGYQFLSVYNPAASGRIFKFKSILISVDTGSLANQVKVTRTTSLGTGSAQTAVKKSSGFSNSVSSIVSALTGNAGLNKDVLGVAKPTTATYNLLNVDYTTATLEDDQIVLRESQGLVVQQLSAGAATEYLTITLEWDEFTAS